MISIISPAKTLNYENIPDTQSHSLPFALEKSAVIIKKLEKLSIPKIRKLMDVSENIARENFERFQEFTLPFTEENAAPAAFVFAGDVYRGLQARDFNSEELAFAQENLRILSGLYGVLKPLDLIQPYRLEMGTSISITPSKKNLYAFWSNEVTKNINVELSEHSDKTLVNIASQEYFKAIDKKKLKGKILDCEFKEEQNGKFTTVAIFSKICRGKMARFIIENRINNHVDIKAFSEDRYIYNPKHSTDSRFTFTRNK